MDDFLKLCSQICYHRFKIRMIAAPNIFPLVFTFVNTRGNMLEKS
jgi:hypothetical protein